MEISIKNCWTGKVILCGKHESIKDCLEKNSSADLSNANLRVAYLSNADLSSANLSSANLSNADLRGADLSSADLSNADLSNANLRGAYLSSANLSNADLRGAKGYYNSHDFWAEVIRRQSLKTFTEKEWSIIGQIIIHRLCWDSIKKRYGKKAMGMFKKLTKGGFREFEEKYKEVLG